MKKPVVSKTFNKFNVVTVIIVILTFTIGILCIYKPFIEKNKALRAEILQQRDKNVLIGKIRGFNKHIQFYEKRIEKNSSISSFISIVSDMASKEKIEVSSIKPGAPEAHNSYNKIYVIVDTASTYSDLGKFIAKIESFEKFFKIESINIKRLDSDSGFDKETSKFKPFDVKANIVISTITAAE